jgi:hypothetical protein
MTEEEKYVAGFYGGAHEINLDDLGVMRVDQTVVINYHGNDRVGTVRYIVPSRRAAVFIVGPTEWLDLPLTVVKQLK